MEINGVFEGGEVHGIALGGAGITGPLAVQSLDQLRGFTSFGNDYATFDPKGRM